MASTKTVRSGRQSHASHTGSLTRGGRSRGRQSPRAAVAAAVSGLELLESRTLMSAVRPDAGFSALDVGVGDDRSFPTSGSAGFSLGFNSPINFFGNVYNGVFVNNNGHISLGARNSFYSNADLDSLPARVIAPFYANVDTRFAGGTVRYGAGMIDGHKAFGVNWLNVDYYPSNAAHSNRNSFQLVLIDRSDLGAGNFDMEFNYDHIGWESGANSGGDASGLGGSTARVGWHANNGTLDGIFQMAGSNVAGSFLDGNLISGLVHNSFMSDVDGRYVFRFRDGTWADAPRGDANTAPVINLPDSLTLVEGSDGTAYLDLAGSFEDPDANNWFAMVDYGDGWGAQPLSLDDARGFALQNPYFNTGDHDVVVTVDDGMGGVAVHHLSLLVVDQSAPVVELVGPQTLSEGQSGVFSFSLANDTDLTDFYSYEWFGNGVSETDGTFHVLADDNGSFTVSVKVTDPSGNYTIVEMPVTVENVAPTASGLSGAADLDEGGTLSLSLDGGHDVSALDLAAGLLYSFDFDGDGLFEIVSGSASASHVYADNGTHVVRARVSDKDGGYTEYSATVNVRNVAPTSSGLSGALDGDEGQALAFSLGAGLDPSSADTAAGLTYSFDFNGDGVFEVVGTSATAGHVFDDNGVYAVRARVSDKDGGHTDYTREVHVRNVAPRLGTFTDNNPVAEGTVVTVSFAGQQDPSGADTAAGFTYSFDFNGDGVFEVSGASPSAKHTFGDNGVFVVTGRVTDKDGGYTDYTTDVEVYNVAPKALGLSAMGTAVEGSMVVVRMDGVSDPSAADRAAGFTYSFDLNNDGVFESVGTNPSASLHFKQNGTYTVRGRVTDKDGGSNDYTSSIVITNAAPVVTSVSNSAASVGGATTSSNVSVTAGFSDAGVLDRHTAVVDWGDGSSGTMTASSSNGLGSASGTHRYAQGGVYTVTVKLTDDAGAVATTTTQVFVTGVGVHNGVLHIVGTGGSDRVTLSKDNRGNIKVKSDFASDVIVSGSSVREIRAMLGAGNDRFDAASDVTQPIYVNGVRYFNEKGGKGVAGKITRSLFSDRRVA